MSENQIIILLVIGGISALWGIGYCIKGGIDEFINNDNKTEE